MEDCLTVLERAHEDPMDEVLVALVKTQLIGEEAQKLLGRDLLKDINQTPTYIHKKNMLMRLNQIRQDYDEVIHTSCK